MKYHSKKDWWVLLVVWIAILFPLICGFCAIHVEREPVLVLGGWISLIIACLFIAALSMLSFPLYYEIKPTTLHIHSGLLQQEIPLSSIQAVFPTHNLLVAAAWSRDRLQINYRLATKPLCAFIAPHDQAKFLLALTKQDPDLEMKTDFLLRRQSPPNHETIPAQSPAQSGKNV